MGWEGRGGVGWGKLGLGGMREKQLEQDGGLGGDLK